MTSRQSSAMKSASKYDFKVALKSIIVPSVATYIISILLFVTAPIIHFSRYATYKGGLKGLSALAKKNIVLCLTGWEDASGLLVGGVFLFCGLLFAVFAFKFIKRKRNVNVFLSTTVDRNTLFKNRITASVLMMAGTTLLPIVADAIINIVVLGNASYVIGCAVALFGEVFVYCLTGFAISSVAMAYCSTVVEGVFFSATIMELPFAVISFVEAMCCSYLRGFNYSTGITAYRFYKFSGTSLVTKTSFINPLILGEAIGDKYGYANTIFDFTYRVTSATTTEDYYSYSYTGMLYTTTQTGVEKLTFNYIAPILIWLVLSLCFILIARKQFIKLKAEDAGVHGTKPVASTLFASVVALTAFSVWINSEYYGIYSTATDVGNFLIGIAAVFLIYYVLMAICRRSIKQKAKSLVAPCVITAVSVATTVLLATGLFGYSSYVPNVEDIDSAMITSGTTDITSAEIFSDSQIYEDSYYGTLLSDYHSGDYVLGVYTDEDDLKTLTNINANIAKKSDDSIYATICVAYKLKNGKTVTRRYVGMDMDAYKSVASLRDTNTAKDELKYLLTGEEKSTSLEDELKAFDLEFSDLIEATGEDLLAQVYQRGNIYVVNSSNINTCQPIENTDEFRQALLTDLLSQTYEQRFDPSEQPIGGVIFTPYNYSADEVEYNDNTLFSADLYDTYNDSLYCYEEQGYYIYPSMTNTINYLKSTGEYSLFVDDGEITSVSIQSVENILDSDGYSINDTELVSFTSVNEYDVNDDDYDDDYEGDYYEDYYSDCYDSYTHLSDYFEGCQEVTNVDEINEIMSKSTLTGYAGKDDYIIMVSYKDHRVVKLVKAENLPDWASDYVQ